MLRVKRLPVGTPILLIKEGGLFVVHHLIITRYTVRELPLQGRFLFELTIFMLWEHSANWNTYHDLILRV